MRRRNQNRLNAYIDEHEKIIDAELYQQALDFVYFTKNCEQERIQSRQRQT